MPSDKSFLFLGAQCIFCFVFYFFCSNDLLICLNEKDRFSFCLFTSQVVPMARAKLEPKPGASSWPVMWVQRPKTLNHPLLFSWAISRKRLEVEKPGLILMLMWNASICMWKISVLSHCAGPQNFH